MSDFSMEQLEEKIQKSENLLKEDLATVRAGRANAALVDKVMVDYYGSPTPLKSLANISVPEPRMIVIQPWESNMLKEVEKAIQISDLGIHPSNDGKVIRLVFPELTEEKRKETSKDVKKRGEGAKVALRNIRRDVMELIKKEKKDSIITEDDQKLLEEKLQKLTDEYIKKVDQMVEAKTKEVMAV